MIQQMNYKTLLVNNKYSIVFRERVRQFYVFNSDKHLVVRLAAKKDDPENDNTPLRENVFCYDMEMGNLKWQFSRGITGMDKFDEDIVVLFDGNYDNYVQVSTGELIRCEFVK